MRAAGHRPDAGCRCRPSNARPGDTARQLNQALAHGLSLLISLGTYRLDKVIRVERPDTIVLGLDQPALTPTRGTAAIDVADV